MDSLLLLLPPVLDVALSRKYLLTMLIKLFVLLRLRVDGETTVLSRSKRRVRNLTSCDVSRLRCRSRPRPRAGATVLPPLHVALDLRRWAVRASDGDAGSAAIACPCVPLLASSRCRPWSLPERVRSACLACSSLKQRVLSAALTCVPPKTALLVLQWLAVGAPGELAGSGSGPTRKIRLVSFPSMPAPALASRSQAWGQEQTVKGARRQAATC